MKILALFCVIAGCSYLVSAGHHGKKCEDKLSDENYLTITKFNGDEVKVTDCADLVQNYLGFCKEAVAKKTCCKSCGSQNLKCVDSLKGFIRKVGDKPMGCAGFVAANPCQCRDKKLRKECCMSCDKVGDLGFCDCMDKLSADSPATVTITDKDGKTETKVLTDCADVVKDYDFLCTEKKFSGKGGSCCESCSGKCVDSKTYRTGRAVKAKTADGKMVKCKKCSCSKIQELGQNHIEKACKKKKTRLNCCKMCSM